MLKNYFKIAWRNLARNKSFAIINTLGLALGFACCILIYAFVSYHLSFDDFHYNSDRIYRIVTEEHRDFIDYESSVPPALGKAFREDYDYADGVARIATYEDEIISFTENNLKQKYNEEIAFVEKEYFDIFNYPLISGGSFDFLEEPNTAMITESLAEKLFSSQDVIGRSIQYDNRIELTIRAVLRDLPENTERRSELYISYPTIRQIDDFLSTDNWNGISSSLQCFTLLKQNVAPNLVENELQKYVAKYRSNSTNVHHYKLQPLAEIHYNTQYDGVISKKTLLVFSFIGLFLIIAACINFINMSTAQAMGRSREIGVQKVLGGYRWQLFRRFMSETALLSLASLLVGTLLASYFLPYLNNWFDVNISVNSMWDVKFMILLAVLFIGVTLFAGVYPGLILSGISPTLALKGKITEHHTGSFFTRKSLIITQFIISQMMVIGMIVIGKQMHYVLNTDLGFSKEAIITVPIPTNLDYEQLNDLKDRFLDLPGVEKVTACLAAPSHANNWGTGLRFDNHAEDEEFSIQVKAADEDYLETFDLELIAGRNIFPSETAREFVVNERLVKKLNLNSPDEIIGKTISVNGGNNAGPVVGVVKDFHNWDLHSEIDPVFITTLTFAMNLYAIKINMNNAQPTIGSIENKWNEVFSNYIFEYEFLDEHIAQFYVSEARTFKLIQVFTVLAILISCLGMFGLISFLVNKRTKEVGVRKVLGGSVAHILSLFINEFLKLGIVAGIVAIPVSWYVMDSWLQNFQYKIEMGVWIFGIAVLGSLVITIITVGVQSLKAALANPARSLRSE